MALPSLACDSANLEIDVSSLQRANRQTTAFQGVARIAFFRTRFAYWNGSKHFRRGPQAP